MDYWLNEINGGWANGKPMIGFGCYIVLMAMNKSIITLYCLNKIYSL